MAASVLDHAETAAVECETFHKLEMYMGSAAFLDKLGQAKRHDGVAQQINDAMSTNITDRSPAGANAEPTQGAPAPTSNMANPASTKAPATGGDAPTAARPDGHIPADAGAACSSSVVGDVMSEDGGYVLIDRAAAVEAMAWYIAESLMRCPQAHSMEPRQLQRGIVEAIQGMKQSRFRQLCRAGTYAYRWTAIGYSAFQMYSNPWIMQAIVSAIIAFSRMTLRPWVG